MGMDESHDYNISLLKLIIATLIIVIISECIGVISIRLGNVSVNLLPMLYAVVLGVFITPDLLGKYIPVVTKLISKKEIAITGNVVMLALLPLGVKYGTLVGPNIKAVIDAGPALILQEIGNLGSVLIAMPLALLLGMKREAIGACSSISREPSLVKSTVLTVLKVLACSVHISLALLLAQSISALLAPLACKLVFTRCLLPSPVVLVLAV